MKTGLSNGETFTMLIDSVVKEFGLTGAAVYGSVYRYCQMREQVCFASQTRIGKQIGVSRSTTNHWLNILVDAGYLQVETRGFSLENGLATNIYCCTKKRVEVQQPNRETKIVQVQETGINQSKIIDDIAERFAMYPD